MKLTQHIDSIRLKINNLKIQPLLISEYTYKQDDKGKYLFKQPKGKSYTLFTLKDHKTNKGEHYQLIEFNGFKKYSNRDNKIKKAFNHIIQILKDNDIEFYLNKIDLAIDFFDIDFYDFRKTIREPKRGLKRNLITKLTETEKQDIRDNRKTYYLEKQTQQKNKVKQRAYIYNKGLKEQLKENIYRFEVSLYNFTDIEKNEDLKKLELDILAIELINKNKTLHMSDEIKIKILKQLYKTKYTQLIEEEIKQRINSYKIDYLGKQIYFDNSLIKEILKIATNPKE